MTGLECLREEMRKRGCNKAQTDSKTVAIVLDIVSNSGDTYTKTVEAEMKVADLERHYSDLSMKVDALRGEYSREYRELHRKQAALDANSKSIREYIEAFLDSLTHCETAEARDSMQKAQMFVNSVDVATKYDNTAFIIGLASILSNGKCGAISELKKLNPMIFAGEKK